MKPKKFQDHINISLLLKDKIFHVASTHLRCPYILDKTMDHISQQSHFQLKNQTNPHLFLTKTQISNPIYTQEMASMTITYSFLGGSAAIAVTKQPSTTTSRRGLVMMANASKVSKVEKVVIDENKEENNTNGRRDMMFAVAAAAALSMAKIALADEEEPKRGTAAAKKKYYPVCVTMPTARICRY